MKTIAHISDLHFGSEDPVIAAALLAELDGRDGPAPTLVAVSGDLTQRARDREFAAARAFLDRLPGAYLVVPGNHDVPLYDVVRRFASPFARYRRHIDAVAMPFYADDEIAVVGVNTAHGFTFKGGRISVADAERLGTLLADQGSRWRAVVAHHPFVVPPRVTERARVVGADAALAVLEAAGVEMIMTGHLHAAHATDEAAFRNRDHTIVALHAGTCISTRTRGEPNGYNRVTIDGDAITIVHRTWDGRRFVPTVSRAYRRLGPPAAAWAGEARPVIVPAVTGPGSSR